VSFTLAITDRDETWAVGVSHGALHHRLGASAGEDAPELAIDHLPFATLAGGDVALEQLIADGEARVEGDRTALIAFFDGLDQFNFGFPIVTP
jgi:alkyl sulfatase BDS1-like metallo-beta-lactamase superfamily hydrolase